jgi:AAA domain, putative AbiEii toxin, Type IV TA system
LLDAAIASPDPASTQASLLDAAIASPDRERILNAAVALYLPTFLDNLAEHITVVVEKTFRDVSYLGPLRTYPPRQLFSHPQHWYSNRYREHTLGNRLPVEVFSHQIDPAVGQLGIDAWERLAADPLVCSQVNTWLSADRLQTPYEVVVREWLDFASLRTQLDQYWQEILMTHNALIEEGAAEEPVNLSEISRYEMENILFEMKEDNSEDQITSSREGWEAELEDNETRPEWELFTELVKRLPISRLHDLRLIDRKRGIEVSHRDIGIGISQVLPVLVGALTLDGILAIEQPELHLHPALQAELGDLFIQSALKHNMDPGNIEPPGSLILETHSEHLILRIMRRMRDTYNGTLPEGVPPIGPNDVALLFVEPAKDGSGSVVRHLQLAEDGELLDPWPGGFFEEGFKERFS